jgi:hypothetical protein
MACWDRLVFGLVTLLLPWAWADALAEDAKPTSLSVESVMPITLETADPAESTQNTIIRLRLSAGQVPASFEVTEVRQEKRATNFASAFKFGTVRGTTPDLAVPLEIILARLPFAGRYVAKAQAVPTAGSPAEAPSEIELTFERPSAQLAIAEEFVLDRDAWTANVGPDALYITEQSNIAFARFASPIVSGQLRGPTGDLLAAVLELSAGDLLRSGQRLALKPVTNGSIPLGMSSGTVRLESPQLAAPVDLKFKLVNRFWIGLLPITIVIFIALGLWYRKSLADRQALDEGVLEAQQAYTRLKDIAGSQAEQALRDRIDTAIAAIAVAIERAESPARLHTAATEAGTDVDAILAEAAESRRKSRAEIASLKSALGRPYGHSSVIAKAIETANSQLDEILRGLDRGFAQSLEPDIAKLRDEITDRLPTLIRALVTEIKTDLEQIGEWPATDIDGEAKKLATAMNDAEAVAPNNMAEIVQASLKVAQATRLLFTRTVRLEVTKVVRAVVAQLELAEGMPGLAEIKSLQDRISTDDPQVVGGEAPYHALAKLVRDLRIALATLVRAEVPSNTAAVETRLVKGDFVAAAAAAAAAKEAQAAKPRVEPYGPARRGGAPRAVGFVPASVVVPDDGLPAASTLRIIAPAAVNVGQTVELQALIEPAVDDPKISWTLASA